VVQDFPVLTLWIYLRRLRSVCVCGFKAVFNLYLFFFISHHSLSLGRRLENTPKCYWSMGGGERPKIRTAIGFWVKGQRTQTDRRYRPSSPRVTPSKKKEKKEKLTLRTCVPKNPRMKVITVTGPRCTFIDSETRLRPRGSDMRVLGLAADNSPLFFRA